MATITQNLTGVTSGTYYASAGNTTLYSNLPYNTSNTPNTVSFVVGANANIQISYPNYKVDNTNLYHELFGNIEVQGNSTDYTVSSWYGLVTLTHKSSHQTIQFQLTKPLGGPPANNSGVNVEFLDGAIAFTSNVNGQGVWSVWATKGGNDTSTWGTGVGSFQIPGTYSGALPADLINANGILNPAVNSSDITNWTGETVYTLTTGIDVVPASAGINVFVGNQDTLNPGDSLTGATGGNNSLDYSTNTNSNESGFATYNVQTFNLTAAGGTATMDMQNANGVSQVNINNSDSNVTLNNVKAVATLEMTNVIAGNTTINYTAAAVAGLSDTQTINIDDVISATNTAASSIVLGTAGIETINLDSSGGASELIGITGNGATTLNVTGNADLSVTNALTGFTTINAATFNGDLAVVADSAGLARDVAITGGNGDDVADFTAGFEAGDSFNGGAGTNTIVLTNAVAAGALGGTLSNVQVLGISNADAVARTIDMDNFSGVGLVDYTVGLAANQTISDAGANIDVTVTNAFGGNNLTVNHKVDGSSDDVTFLFEEISAGNTLGTVADSRAETVTVINNIDAAGTVGDLTIANLSIADATTLNLQGDADLTITAATTAATPLLTSLDASLLSGDLTISGLNTSAAGADFILGTGNDVYNVATSNGADTFDLTLGGTDEIVYNALAQSDSEDTDTVLGFATGDIINVRALGTNTSARFLGNYATFGLSQGALTGIAGQAVFEQDTSTLWVDVDGNAVLNASDFRVVISSVTSLTAANLGLGLVGNSITLTAPAANVTLTTQVNATNVTTINNDSITSSIANLAGSTIDGAAGTDTLTLSDAGAVGALAATITNVESLVLANGTNTGLAFNAAGAFTNVTGGTGADTIANTANLVAGGSIALGEGNDTITNFSANLAGTTIDMGAGDDTITSNVAAITTTLTGGTGANILNLAVAGANNLTGAVITGFQTVNSANGADIVASATNLTDVTALNVGAGGAATDLTLNAGTYNFSAKTVTFGAAASILSLDGTPGNITATLDAADVINANTITGNAAGVTTLNFNDTTDLSARTVTAIDVITIAGANQTLTVDGDEAGTAGGQYLTTTGSGTSNLVYAVGGGAGNMDLTTTTISGFDSINAAAALGALDNTLTLDALSIVTAGPTAVTVDAVNNLSFTEDYNASNWTLTGADLVTLAAGVDLVVADTFFNATAAVYNGNATGTLTVNMVGTTLNLGADSFGTGTDIQTTINGTAGNDTITFADAKAAGSTMEVNGNGGNDSFRFEDGSGNALGADNLVIADAVSINDFSAVGDAIVGAAADMNGVFATVGTVATGTLDWLAASGGAADAGYALITGATVADFSNAASVYGAVGVVSMDNADKGYIAIQNAAGTQVGIYTVVASAGIAGAALSGVNSDVTLVAVVDVASGTFGLGNIGIY